MVEDDVLQHLADVGLSVSNDRIPQTDILEVVLLVDFEHLLSLDVDAGDFLNEIGRSEIGEVIQDDVR